MTRPPPVAKSAVSAWAPGLVVLGVTGFLLTRLIPQAAAARFQSDECFHAWMAEWISAHWTLPVRIEGLYSGFPAFYPPLLHIAGAVGVSLFGADSLRFLGVVVHALLLITVAIAVGRRESPRAARWALYLILANLWLGFYALVLYAEALSTLLTVGFVLALLALRDDPRRGRALAVGALAGLALLTKQSALALPAILLALACGYALGRRGALARGLLLAAGVALLVALPLYLRNLVLYGSPIYPALAPDAHPLLVGLNQARFTPDVADFYARNVRNLGIATAGFVLTALAATLLRRRWSLEAGLIAACLAAILLGPLQPMLDPRHLNPAIAALAVLAVIVVSRWLGSRRRWALVVESVLVVASVVTIARMPALRAAVDQPPGHRQAYRAVETHVPPGATVLSLWTYDTFYYAHRNSTWPIAWGQRHPPLEMFLTADCDSVMSALDRHGIEYILTPLATGDSVFTGSGYPPGFIRCEGTLVADGRLSVLWRSGALALLRRRP